MKKIFRACKFINYFACCCCIHLSLVCWQLQSMFTGLSSTLMWSLWRHQACKNVLPIMKHCKFEEENLAGQSVTKKWHAISLSHPNNKATSISNNRTWNSAKKNMFSTMTLYIRKNMCSGNTLSLLLRVILLHICLILYHHMTILFKFNIKTNEG